MGRMVQNPTCPHIAAHEFELLNASEISQVEGLLTRGVIMDKHAIELSGAAKYGPYSAGVEAGDVFWLSGQIAVDFDGIKAQTQGALDKIDTLLDCAELTREHICFAQILLDDINDFAAMNEVYGAWVSELKVKPARAAFAAAALPAGALVEIVVQGTR